MKFFLNTHRHRMENRLNSLERFPSILKISSIKKLKLIMYLKFSNPLKI